MVNKSIKFESARAHIMIEIGRTYMAQLVFNVKVREVNFDSYFNETSLEHDVGLYLVT